MTTYFHKGWTISRDLGAPSTGRYKAWRDGVRIGAESLNALVSMIEQRNREERHVPSTKS